MSSLYDDAGAIYELTMFEKAAITLVAFPVGFALGAIGGIVVLVPKWEWSRRRYGRVAN